VNEWFSENISRCSAERDRNHGKERDLWTQALECYKHLLECKLRHSWGEDAIPLCMVEVDRE